MKVYRVWFEPEGFAEVCCVLVAAQSESRALMLARQKVQEFPALMSDKCKVVVCEFDTSEAHASIC